MAEKLKVGNSECYYKIVSCYNNVQFMYGDIEINDVKGRGGPSIPGRSDFLSD